MRKQNAYTHLPLIFFGGYLKSSHALLGIFSIILLSSAIFAGCSEDAYVNGCNGCKFDNATGKFDRTCTDAKKNEGTACLATSYPVAMANYRNGNCSMVDKCISDLNSCTASVSSGNEKADCAEGSTRTCYAVADACFKNAAAKCSNIQNPCPAPAGLAIVAGAAAIWGMFRRKKSVTPHLLTS
jgi:hypothetical protein